MTMTLPEIERALGQLRLSGVRDTLETRVLQAQGSQQPFLETFALILQDELDRRQSRLIERRYKLSGLEEIKRWVLSWSGEAVVVKPPELAALVKASAQNLLRPRAGA